MNTRFAVLAAALALASPALAADTYQFDKSHTDVGFQVRHIFTMLSGRFQDFSRHDQGRPRQAARAPRSSSRSRPPASTRTTPSATSTCATADFFDVANHPTITFKSTSVKAKGKDAYEVTGDLTMRGVTKPVTLPVTFLGEGKDPWGNEKMGFEITTTLNRKDYGIVWNRALDQGGVLVGDEVKVEISVEANKLKQPRHAAK